jgi:hypothetical protein
MDGVKKINKAIKILKDHVKKDINVDQVEILFLLADKEPEPVSYSTLSKLMNKSQASIMRNIEMLSGHYLKDPTTGEWVDIGFGLVKTSPSQDDPEENVAFLTDRGIKIMRILDELIE